MKVRFDNTEASEPEVIQLEVTGQGSGLRVKLDGQEYSVDGGFAAPGVLQLRIDGKPVRALTASRDGVRWLARGTERFVLKRADERRDGRRAGVDTGDDNQLTSSMPGQVLKVLVEEGDRVSRGQPVLIIEAMKMEHELKAPYDGVVKRIAYQAGAMVDPGIPLAEIERDKENMEDSD